MKKLFAILTITALALPAFAQFRPGPSVGQALVCPAAGFSLIAAAAATNVATAGLAPSFSLTGADNPVCLYIESAGTNASATISNIVMFFQYSADGSDWIGPSAIVGANPTLAAAIPGAASVRVIYPLLSCPKANAGIAAPAYIPTCTNMSAWRYIRLQLLSNNTPGDMTNTFFITNLWFIQR